MQVARCSLLLLSFPCPFTAIARLHIFKEDGEIQSARTVEAPTGAWNCLKVQGAREHFTSPSGNPPKLSASLVSWYKI